MGKEIVCIECRDIERHVPIGDDFAVVVRPVLFHCRYRKICKFCKEPSEPSGMSKTRKFSECKTYLRYCKKFGDEVDFKSPEFTVEVVK